MAAKPQAPANVKPAFKLLPLTAEDAHRCVDIYFAAFQNPHSLACWPRVPSIRAFWEHMILDELAEPGAHWLKAVVTSPGASTNDVPDLNTAQRIAGFCKWVAPKPGQVPDTTLPQWPAEADDLEIVATDPAYQGQGAGSQILRWGTERADADDVEAYLEAAPDAVRLYEKSGFREAGRTDTYIENERVKGEWYRNLYMLRPRRDTRKGEPQR
ncbi:hypothetical protein B0A48_00624 [Cryoendolithus antarcticus]|uniref:N-acetyltransferase domain-containing protein n=1 Tax=Cryoendolithus antarcticus TaxID=1507870 RepID=A0A1V8TVD7_9PEZI|nr:hypothetical protein B0A48_00624 [Cryoendolithus antarcticus]